jgi:peptidoglycan hydrolase-like protein with peptidoglycan-binding domain
MQLQGRNLSMEMHGDDVALLQRELGLLGFSIPGDEIEQRLFGQGTRQAVLLFQRQHLQQGLEPSGVVDERTAAAINAEVDALPPRQFGVRGQVRQADGTPGAGLVVRAFDEDPERGEVLLGETASGAGGAYEVSYTSRDFDDRQGQRPGPDLLVRALDAQGTVVATSQVVARGAAGQDGRPRRRAGARAALRRARAGDAGGGSGSTRRRNNVSPRPNLETAFEHRPAGELIELPIRWFCRRCY